MAPLRKPTTIEGRASSADLVAAPKHRLFEDIVQFLTSAMEAGRLRPGDRLKPERELAAELGVSRGSLREALKALEMLGVVELRHGRGVFVTLPQPQALSKIFGTLISMQPNQADDIMEARIALECYATRLACRNASGRDIARIRGALEKLIAEAALGSGEHSAEADHDFHSAIIESTGNATLVFLYSAITGLLKRGHHERWLSLSANEAHWTALNAVHERIFEAISAHDEDRAAAVMAEHFDVIARILAEHSQEGRAPLSSIAYRPRAAKRED